MPGPCPAHRPRLPCLGREEAALGAGTRRAARNAEPDPEPDAAAAATCAAVIKVGRPRATGHTFPVCAMCARCASGLQRPGRDAGARRTAGDPAGLGGPGFQPLCVTLHKALLLSRPQFPHRDSGPSGGPFLAGLLGGAASSSSLPTARGLDGYCLHSPPAVRASYAGCGESVPTVPPLVAWVPRGTCVGTSSLSWLSNLLGLSFPVQETGRGGHPQVPIEPVWACRVGRSESACQVCLPVWGWGSPGLEVVGPSATDLPRPDPCRYLYLGNGVEHALPHPFPTSADAQLYVPAWCDRDGLSTHGPQRSYSAKRAMSEWGSVWDRADV